jgi:hypothetical protein
MSAEALMKQQFNLSPSSISKSLEQAKFIFPPTSLSGGTGRLGTPSSSSPPIVASSPPNTPPTVQSPIVKAN